MDSTWYVYPHQTEYPKLRNKALVATPKAWKKITGYLEGDKKRQEAVEKERARRQYLKDECYAMTKDWDNSIEKIRQNFIEDQENKLKEKEQNLVKRYLELRTEQEEERKKIIDEAKRKMYMTQEKPRSLNSALLLSEVLYERNLQKEFDKKGQDHEKIEDEKYAALVRLNAEKEKQENAKKRIDQKATDIEHCVDLKKQIKENAEREKKSREARLRKGILENQRSVEEAELQKQKELRMREEKKKQVRREVDEFNQMQKTIRDEQKRLEALQDKVTSIYSNAKCRIEDKKQQRLKEVKEEKIKIRDKLAAKCMAKQADFETHENAIMENAKKEYDERELKQLESKKTYQKKLVQDLMDYRKECIDRKIKEDHRKNEIQKLELCNRLKTNEVIDVYDRQEKQKVIDGKMEYKNELFKQLKEIGRDVQFNKKCKKQELQYYKNKYQSEHDVFFAYANEVLDTAKQRGRCLDPILKVIEQYKVENELKPKKKNRSMLESKVPINN